MAWREIPLDEYVTGTAAADGTCIVQLGPTARQVWRVENAAVQCVSPVVPPAIPASPTAKVYTGPSTAGNYYAGTYDGVNDNAGIKVKMNRNGKLTCLWENCDPGSKCTFSVYGVMVVPAK